MPTRSGPAAAARVRTRAGRTRRAATERPASTGRAPPQRGPSLPTARCGPRRSPRGLGHGSLLERCGCGPRSAGPPLFALRAAPTPPAARRGMPEGASVAARPRSAPSGAKQATHTGAPAMCWITSCPWPAAAPMRRRTCSGRRAPRPGRRTAPSASGADREDDSAARPRLTSACGPMLGTLTSSALARTIEA